MATGTYEALKRAGHSPAKAAEIILDGKRGVEYARYWINAVASDLATPAPVLTTQLSGEGL